MPTRVAINKLKNDLIAMGEMCEHALASAVMALVDRDADLSCYVIDYDAEINEMELAVDRNCLELLGSGKLSDRDLRFVSAASKINNDLERVGDLAVGVCEHVLFLTQQQSVLARVVDFHYLLEQVSAMMRESIASLLESDTELAWKIIDEQRIVDDEIQLVFRELLDVMKMDARTIERCCHVLFIVQSLGRVADQATNIAEEVIFTVEGRVVRHHIRDFHPVVHTPLQEISFREAEKVETAILKKRKPREKTREEHHEAKRATKIISREEVKAAAVSSREKAQKVKEKILSTRQKS